MSGPCRHLLLYDGVCGLCDWLVQAVLAHDRAEAFDFAALQSPEARDVLARFGASPDPLDTVYVVVDYQGSPALLGRGRAAVFVLAALGWPWKAGGALRVLPTSLLDRGYDLVARHRYRLFGKYDQCLLPRPEHRARFIDMHAGTPPPAGTIAP
jgi:predicted DCC family thiol-disulfide oxidoreductase YuxK